MKLTMKLSSLFALVAFAGCASPKLLATPLNWNPSDDLNDLHVIVGEYHNGWGGTMEATGADMSGQVADAFAGQQLQVMPLTDARTNKDIGQNLQKDAPRPVTTPDNVADFVTAHVGDVLKACRVPVATAGGTRILKGELNEYFVKEDSRYDGSVVIRFTLTDAQGHELWSGTEHGEQNKFGRSFEADNYNENLSDATVRAVHALLMDKAFLAAVHKGTK